ncbi:TIGR03619 family F420-dependent LLM class oxidoreductase [Actinophytocola oryzae]|uniref:TIGR03619 family F420-dependent LLM class oxidoreductase n=1 Tax=Actinophytocola oryzae TaxID=502181 RepID=UPI00106250A2|nr:TIGR03619 family F420-dependent LLM class oxidoreductase [Actinophytocola oryzae]
MRIGLGAPVSGAWATPETLAGFAARAEELGYDSLWTFQRLLVGVDDKLGPEYQSVLDPLLALTFAAAHTRRIRLGVALVNLPFISPVYLAKQAATLDVLSHGRLDLGLGVGWSPTEFAATGASRERRGARAEEYVRVLRTLWTEDPVSFDGEFYQVPPSHIAPRPVQVGGPPILLGGVVPAALRRAGRIAAGWMSRSAHDLDGIAEDIAVVRGASPEPSSVRVVVRGVIRLGERKGRLSGTYDDIRADTAWLAEQGVTELYYDLNWDRRIGNPTVPADDATALAMEIAEALAPARH